MNKQCETMNNLYCFYIAGQALSEIYVAAPTWKKARNITLKQSHVYKEISSLPEVKGKRILEHCTNRAGIVTMDVLCKEFPWWTCSCGNKSFLVLDSGDMYRCNTCGKEGKILKPEGLCNAIYSQ